MHRYIATFCQWSSLHCNFVSVEADSYGAARQKMFNTYKHEWAFLYDSEEAAGVHAFDLKEVPFGTPQTRL